MKPKPDSRQVGLARALSKLGYCSRSKAFGLIRAGSVCVNGASRRDPETPVHLESDRIEVEGCAVSAKARAYLMLNKPRGVVTTTSDEQGRRTVYDLLGAGLPWVAPVGRLDKVSEGLLLLTNDSEWAAQASAPATHLEKIYHVQINRLAEDSLLSCLQEGVRTPDGAFLRVKRACRLRHGGRNSWIEVVLEEGKNRQIRRLLQSLEIEVLRLVRVAIGPLAMGELAKGSYREITPEEKRSLDAAMKPIRPVRSAPGRERQLRKPNPS